MTRRFVCKLHIVRFVALFLAATAVLFLTVTKPGQASAQSSAEPGSSAPTQTLPHILPLVGQDVQGVAKGRFLAEKASYAGPDSGTSLLLPPVTYSTGGNNPASVAIADVDRDGNLDLVVANSCSSANACPIGEGSVGVLLGKGDGTFQAPVVYDAGGSGAYSVIVADVNGDGEPDIVVAGGCSIFQMCATGGVAGVLLGKGDGTFQPVVTYGSGGVTAVSVASADVNRDGKLDLLVSNQCVDFNCANGSVGVLLGNGDGTFQTAVAYSSDGYFAGGIAVADLKGDGRLDLVVTNLCATTCGSYPYSDGTVGVLLGNGDGTFQPAVLYDSGGASTRSVVLSDVNGDGKFDLLTANCGIDACRPESPGGAVGVLIGNGDGTFQSATAYAAGNSPTSIVIADLNGDGKKDVIVANWGTSENPPTNNGATTVLLGNDDGTFQPAQTYLSGGNEATSVAVADLNGDGQPDVVLGDYGSSGANPPAGIVSVMLNGIGSTQSPTTTTLVYSLNPSNFGQSVTFTAAVSSASGTPTGTVIFYNGSTTLGSATLANGSASLSTASLAAGSHSITAAYQGSAAFALSTSSPLTQVVYAVGTTTAVVSSPNPAGVNRVVTYTATVTSQYGGVATGSVTFQDGVATIATVPVYGNQAAYATTYSTAGVHSITATYSGDASNGGSASSSLTEGIGKAHFPSETTLATSGSPSFVGQPLTLTATVTSIYGAIPNGELVTFYDDGTTVGTGITAGGVATLTTSLLTAKTHTLKATYAGDATFERSSGIVTQVADKYATTTTLISSLNPSVYGQSVTWTATVTSTGPNTPTGSVRFVGLGYAPLSGGVATFTNSWLNAGTHAITAEYEGDSASAASESSVLSQVVNPASTTTVISSSADPSTFGQNVTFTATVTSSTGAQATGTVTFTATGRLLGTVPLEGSVATFSTATLPVASFAITAIYNGATDFTGSSDMLVQSVEP